MAQRNVVDVLTYDHTKLRGLLFEVENTVKSAEIYESLLEKICKSISKHTEAEEKILYPKLLKIFELEDITREAYEEHSAVDLLLDELLQKDPNDENWLAMFKVIKENIEHHIQEEEENIFPMLSKHFSMKQLLDMGEMTNAILTEDKSLWRQILEALPE